MIAPVRSLTRHLWGETLANAKWRDYKATLNPLRFIWFWAICSFPSTAPQPSSFQPLWRRQ